MVNEIAKLDSTVFICDQTGDCGELIDPTGMGGLTFVSQTTGGLVKFSGEDITVVDAFIDNFDQFVRENKRLVGIYAISPRAHTTPEELEMFKGHKPAEPLKDTPIQHTREFPEESIRRLITPDQEKEMLLRLEKVIEIYKKTAKPADAERLSEGLEKLFKDLQEKQKGEEGLRGEEIRMYREPFEEATDSFLESSSEVTITPEQIDRARDLVIEVLRKAIDDRKMNGKAKIKE